MKKEKDIGRAFFEEIRKEINQKFGESSLSIGHVQHIVKIYFGSITKNKELLSRYTVIPMHFTDEDCLWVANVAVAYFLEYWLENDSNARQTIYSFTKSPYLSFGEVDTDKLSRADSDMRIQLGRAREKYQKLQGRRAEQITDDEIYASSDGASEIKSKSGERDTFNSVELCWFDMWSNDEQMTVLQEFFCSFEFNDIQNLLFVPRWTDLDVHAKNAFLADNCDLSALSDEELRNAFKRFEPKSDWNRFFNSKITDVDFEAVIDTVRIHRNAVAHCKFFYKDSYKDCTRAINQLNKAILLAIKLTEEEDFAKKNNAALRESMVSVKESFAQYSEKLSEITKQITQVMYPSISQKLGELTMNIASAYTMPWADMRSTLSEIAEYLSMSSMLKDAFKPLNISEMLSEVYQIPPAEDISNSPPDDESLPLTETESTEEPMDGIDQ